MSHDVKITRLRYAILAVAATFTTSCTAGEGPHGAKTPKAPTSVPQEWVDSDCKGGRMDFGERGLCYLFVAAKLPPLDPSRRDNFGEQYDPKKFAECAHAYTTIPNSGWNCEVFRLRRHENPEFWPYPNVPKPKFPEAPNPPTYKKGMNADEYFKALCEREAGEFIYKTVENVEGIYAIRPMASEDSDERVQDRYVIENPFDYFTQGSPFPRSQMGFSFLGKSADRHRDGYLFFETMNSPRHSLTRDYYDASLFVTKPSDKPVERFIGYDGTGERQTMKREFDAALKAQYGFTWRGIRRPHDMEMGIKGGELIVLHLKTSEVLAIRRNFVRSGGSSGNRFHWYSSQSCPALHSVGNPNTKQWTDEFIAKVLKPIPHFPQSGVK